MKQIFVLLCLLLFSTACSPVKNAGEESTPFLNSVLKSIGFEIANFFPAQKGSMLIISQKSPHTKQQIMNEFIADKLALFIVSVHSAQSSIIDKSVAISAFGNLEQLLNFNFLSKKENLKKLNRLNLKYLVVIKSQAIIRTKLNDPQIDAQRYYLKTDLQVKILEIKSSKIIWAKQAVFYYPQQRVAEVRRRRFPGRKHRNRNNRMGPPPRR